MGGGRGGGDREDEGFGQLERRLATIPLYRVKDLGLVGVDKNIKPWLGLWCKATDGPGCGRSGQGQGEGSQGQEGPGEGPGGQEGSEGMGGPGSQGGQGGNRGRGGRGGIAYAWGK